MNWRERRELLGELDRLPAIKFRKFTVKHCDETSFMLSFNIPDHPKYGKINIKCPNEQTSKAYLEVNSERVCNARRLARRLVGAWDHRDAFVLGELMRSPIGDWEPGHQGPVKDRPCEFRMTHPWFGILLVKTWDIRGEDAILFRNGVDISGAMGLYFYLCLCWSGTQMRRFERELLAKPGNEWTKINVNTFETTWRGDKIQVWHTGEQYHLSVADRPLNWFFIESKIWRHVCRAVELRKSQQSAQPAQ